MVGEPSKPKCPFEEETKDLPPSTLFLPMGWRSQICKCDNCTKRMDEAKLPFLVDDEDTVHHYEAKSKGEKQSKESCARLSQTCIFA